MSWFDDFFSGGKNPANAAMPYLNQIPGQTKQYQQPFYEAGKEAIPGLQEQYKSLLDNPGNKLNQIGSNYKESPGLQFAIQKALGANGRALNAGGMYGSPEHEEQNLLTATGYANQDYNNWLGQATGLYNQGLSGQQGMANQGQQAGQNLADMVAQTLAQQGNLAFQGQSQKNQNQNDLWGNIFNGAGALGAFNPWGMFGNI
jgi:hypothetical protein